MILPDPSNLRRGSGVMLLVSVLGMGSACETTSRPALSDLEELIEIPAGEHLLGRRPPPGSPPPPVQRVKLSAFAIDRTEVTLGQYARFVDETGYKPPFVAEAWAAPYNWVGGHPPAQLERHPVTLVSWYDADAYCRWAGKRLPSSFEWDRAARGDDQRLYPWGDTWMPLAANHGRGGADGYDATDGYELTSPVGSFPAGRSPFGLEDTFGNAWEWTSEWFMHGPPASSAAAGASGRAPQGAYYRTARGGSFFFDLEHHGHLERLGMLPSSRRKTSGFRCARGI